MGSKLGPLKTANSHRSQSKMMLSGKMRLLRSTAPLSQLDVSRSCIGSTYSLATVLYSMFLIYVKTGTNQHYD